MTKKLCALKKIILCFFFFLNSFVLLLNGQDIRDLLPQNESLPGWKLVDSVRTFTGDDLYSLIDGGAELFLEYGFTRVAAASYENASKASIQAEIYQMSSDSAAYGFFTTMQTVSAKKITFGQDALLFNYYLVLWKGPYFATITGSESSENVQNAVLKTASFIDGNIHVTGKVPSWLSVLPEEGLVEKKYVKGNIGLSNIYSFGSGNVFAVKEAVCATYHNLRLFVFKYQDASQAGLRLKSAAGLISKSNLFKEVQIKDIGFQAVDTKKNRVVAYQMENYIVVYVYSDEKEFKRLKKLLTIHDR